MLTLTLTAILATSLPAGILSQDTPRTLTHANLSVYPLMAGSALPATSTYISLDEGLKNKTVTVTESGAARPTPLIRRQTNQLRQQQISSPSGEVNRLLVTNSSGKKLLLLAGEMVIGGKQDRILEKDTLILPGKEAVDISVYCVEHGRWTPAAHSVAGGAGFGGAPALAQPSVRGAAQNERSQQKVWDNVSVVLKSADTASSTQAYRMNLENRKLQGSIDAYVKKIQPGMPQNAIGAVVAVNGRFVWMDRFASPSLFRKYWPKLVQSYAMEAQTSSSKAVAAPTYADAFKYASTTGGKKTFEGVDSVFKLTKTEAPNDVLYEIEDVSRKPALVLHSCKQKR